MSCFVSSHKSHPHVCSSAHLVSVSAVSGSSSWPPTSLGTSWCRWERASESSRKPTSFVCTLQLWTSWLHMPRWWWPYSGWLTGSTSLHTLHSNKLADNTGVMQIFLKKWRRKNHLNVYLLPISEPMIVVHMLVIYWGFYDLVVPENEPSLQPKQLAKSK